MVQNGKPLQDHRQLKLQAASAPDLNHVLGAPTHARQEARRKHVCSIRFVRRGGIKGSGPSHHTSMCGVDRVANDLIDGLRPGIVPTGMALP